MAADPTAAHATFLEISFVMNTLFAAYRDLQERFEKSLTLTVTLAIAKVQTQENELGADPDRVKNIVEHFQKYYDQHSRFQRDALNHALGFAILFAIAAVGILYFNLIDYYGNAIGFLILPFPVFCVVHFINYLIFDIRRRWTLGRYIHFIEDFEKPKLH
jgi:hypothetical protein